MEPKGRPPIAATGRASIRTLALRLSSLLLITTVMVAGCTSGRDGTAPGTSKPTSTEAVSHVHGLGVDPADGMLYAATHSGVFRLPGNTVPQRVGELRQDTMGFTVVGPGQFLGSGHPDPDDPSAPANLGLTESTDAGKTWRPISLYGQIDFHALEAKHGLVHGYSSTTGELMVSADRRSWQKLAPVQLADFTVSPVSPVELLASTQQGPVRSTDGGRSFAPIPGAPLVQLLEWTDRSTINAISPNGRVWVSPDGGASWEPRAQLDSPPQAMTVAGQRWYVATETGVVVSVDGGHAFEPYASLS